MTIFVMLTRVVHNNAFLDNDLGGLGMSYH